MKKKEDDKIRESSGMWSTAINQPKADNSQVRSLQRIIFGFSAQHVRAILTITQREKLSLQRKNTELIWENICKLPVATR